MPRVKKRQFIKWSVTPDALFHTVKGTLSAVRFTRKEGGLQCAPVTNTNLHVSVPVYLRGCEARISVLFGPMN